MKDSSKTEWLRTAMGFVGAALVGSWMFAQDGKPSGGVRGQPIKPAAPKGQPIVRASTNTPAARPTNATVVGPPASSTNAPAKPGGPMPLGFDQLAGFNYVVPEYTGTTPPPAPDTNQIPASVRGLDGKTVAVKGFMLPLKVKDGKVQELLLMRDQSMCCFGAVPKINEFLTVKMTGEGTRAVMDQAVTLVGKLKVGEFSENGYLLGIYQLDADRAEGPGL
ncbi:MAG: hypothetical protein RL153_821 [Verrucomicrobiota bacterium]|jgi:hypothetical protein